MLRSNHDPTDEAWILGSYLIKIIIIFKNEIILNCYSHHNMNSLHSGRRGFNKCFSGNFYCDFLISILRWQTCASAQDFFSNCIHDLKKKKMFWKPAFVWSNHNPKQHSAPTLCQCHPLPSSPPSTGVKREDATFWYGNCTFREPQP